MKLTWLSCLAGMTALCLMTLVGCGDNSTDDRLPATIAGLNVIACTHNTATITWPAPGDDGAYGTATAYLVRYSTTPITLENWDIATPYADAPLPAKPGSIQSVTLTGLTPLTTYYLAIRTVDDVGNISDISNVLTFTTKASPDTVAPAAITDLHMSQQTQTSITLAWVAPGDDEQTGTAASYDLRYSTAPITLENWADATSCTGLPAPKTAGEVEQYTVTGLTADTTYYFAIRTSDEAPNVSALSNVWAQSTLSEETMVTYDDVTVNSIGIVGGGTFTVASLFTAPELNATTGYIITKVAIKIWGNKSYPATITLYRNNGGVLEDVYSCSQQAQLNPGWNIVTLDTPVDVSAVGEVWAGYSLTHLNGEYPMAGGNKTPLRGMMYYDTDELSWKQYVGYNLNMQLYVCRSETNGTRTRVITPHTTGLSQLRITPLKPGILGTAH